MQISDENDESLPGHNDENTPSTHILSICNTANEGTESVIQTENADESICNTTDCNTNEDSISDLVNVESEKSERIGMVGQPFASAAPLLIPGKQTTVLNAAPTVRPIAQPSAQTNPSLDKPSPETDSDGSAPVSKSVRITQALADEIELYVEGLPDKSVHSYLVKLLINHRLLSEGKRQFDELKKANDTLKWEVKAKTDELAESNKKLQEAIVLIEGQARRLVAQETGSVAKTEPSATVEPAKPAYPDLTEEVSLLKRAMGLAEVKFAEQDAAITKWKSYADRLQSQLSGTSDDLRASKADIDTYMAVMDEFYRFAEQAGAQMGGVEYYAADYYQQAFENLLQNHITANA